MAKVRIEKSKTLDELIPMDNTPKLTVNEFLIQEYGIPLEKASPQVKMIDERMKTYIERMNGRVQITDPRDGGQNQNHLYTTLLRALSEKDNDLFMCVDVILTYIHLNRDDTFSDRMVYRFGNHFPDAETRLQTFLNILEVFILLSNPTTRAAYATSDLVRHTVGRLADSPMIKNIHGLVTYLSHYDQ